MARSGGWPRIGTSLPSARSAASSGRAFSSATVYGCRGPREEGRRARLFDDVARVHHRHVVARLGDDAEVVRDEEDRHAVLALELEQEREDLILDRDVERGGRLVGEQDPRLARDGDRDHHPLAHPARELVRIGVEAAA